MPERPVVAVLPLADHRLDGDMLEHRMDIEEDPVLPQPPDAPVSVGERMDELELVVAPRDAGGATCATRDP
jgi:hypothetical protein